MSNNNDSVKIEESTKNIYSLLGDAKVCEIKDFLDELLKSRGVTQLQHNQLILTDIPDNLSDMIFHATAGYSNVKGKRFALEASKIYHEIISHSNEEKECSRGQLPYNSDYIFQILDAMINPDIIEDVSHGDSLDQRTTYATAKITTDCVVVVLSVGGRRNPNVTPQQIIRFQKGHWNELIESGKTIREILYANSKKRDSSDEKLISDIKKNRVTVAHRES